LENKVDAILYHGSQVKKEEILLQMFSGKVAPSGTMTFPVKYEDTHSKLDWNSAENPQV
jgi:hypothetical protein